MSDNEEFLARWSRRKREAERPGQFGPEPVQPAEPQNLGPSDGAAAEAASPEFNLSSLPSLDSIDAATDITAFLRKGIPQDLTRAALRRAWTTDPAIRDFVGLAENGWDFNAPNAMPGFGPLGCSETGLNGPVDRIVAGVRQAVASLPDTPVAAEDAGRSTARESSPEQGTVPMQTIADERMLTAANVPPASVAPQPATAEETEREGTCVRRRKSGGALPR